MQHIRGMVDDVGMFIAPSPYLLRRFIEDFGLPQEKVTLMECGLDTHRFKGRRRVQHEPFTFGYIGTHIPAKGVAHLISAFGLVRGDARLRIWGRARTETEALKNLAEQLGGGVADRIEWCGEYRNQDIVKDVFNHTDAIVVPSVWVENSPLVIREAQQAGVPVITADVGGMAELVHHEVNGLLFQHRNPADLATQMQRFIDNPRFARQMADRGYLLSPSGDVPDIREHAAALERIYAHLISTSRGNQT
jgi:glycosyltransferase involved in cell wall biosynthesis